MPRYSYRDSYGIERVIDAPDLDEARRRIVNVERRRSDSVAAADVAARSAVQYDVTRTDTPAPAVLGAAELAAEPVVVEPGRGVPESRVAVVFDLEADDGPTPLGVFLNADEDTIVYRSPSGEARSAPADCVIVRVLDVLPPTPALAPYSPQALQAIIVDTDEAEPVAGPIASYAEVSALQAAIEALQAIEDRAQRGSWKAPSDAGSREPTAFALGRCAEACDRAEWEIQNALTTLSVLAHDRAAKALDIAIDQQREARDDD